MKNRKMRRGDRRRPQPRQGTTITIVPGPPVSDAIWIPSLDEILSGVEFLAGDPPWAEVAARVIPIFQRVRPSPVEDERPVLRELPLGVTVAFGIDLEHAYARVTEQMLVRWRVTADAVQERALANLSTRAAALGPRDVMRVPSEDGYVIRGIQPEGAWASALVLLPDELGRIFGRDPQVFVAPMRAVLMSFPAHVDRETVAYFAQELEALDPNALRLDAFLYRDGQLSIEALPRAGDGIAAGLA